MKTKSNHYVAVFISIVLFVSVFSILVKYTIFEDIDKRQSMMANKLLVLLHSLYEDGEAVLTNLQQQNATTCSPDLLLAMRRSLFAADYVKDIGFIKEGVIQCTTGLGLTQIKDTLVAAPTFITDDGIKIWIRQPFQLKVLGNQIDEWTLARKNHFSLIIKPQISTLDADLIYPWELIKLSSENENHAVHIDGDANLWNELKNASFVNQILNHDYRACSTERQGYCVVIKSPLLQSVGVYFIQYFLLLVVSLIVMALSYSGMKRLEKKYFSYQKRVERGLNNHTFYWLYQPLVDLKSGKVIGCEALARFDDQEGSISPEHFIPIVRNMNLSWKFTEMMVEHIMDDFEQATELPDGLKISINIFPYDIQKGNAHALTLNKRLTESRFKIALEVTEDEYLEYESAQHVLSDLVDAGFSISIDDLGTGYSNLKLLDQLNASYVKIDRSFVKGIEHDGLKSSIIPHIVEIANKFEMEVIAEGIETKVQADIIDSMGVTFGQGWFFGKPMTLAALSELIKQKNNHP